MSIVRVGQGYDVHQLVENRQLIIGGVHIPFERGLAGHSDADVLLHAICDALLGAVALGDIGQHFPDNDPAYAGADSRKLLKSVLEKVIQQGFSIGNLDATIIAQSPRLAEYIFQMRENIAEDLAVDIQQVNIKATTTEKLGFIGRQEGIAAEAIALLYAQDELG